VHSYQEKVRKLQSFDSVEDETDELGEFIEKISKDQFKLDKRGQPRYFAGFRKLSSSR
jgi:hypothetical protein